jgi:hypothetical protein
MPAVTNFLVSSLPNYVATNRDLIIKSFGLVGTGTRGKIGLQTGVKKVAALNYLALNAAFQDGSECGFNALDEITLSQKNITTAAIKVNGQICPETLLGKYAEYLVRVNATEHDMPFEQYIVDTLVKQINKGIETLIWTGSTTGGDLINGFLTQFAADNGVITVTLTGVAAAYDAVKAVYFAMPEEALERGGAIFVDPAIFRALLNDLVVLNFFHYDMGNGNPEEILLPGMDVRVIKAQGLASTKAIVGTFADNLVYGTDMENDNEAVDIWWSQDDRLFKYEVKWASGVAYHFGDQVVLGAMDDAPVPMGACPCAAPADGGE